MTIRILLMLAFLILVGCNTSPVIVPDNTTDSPVMMKLKHDITNGGSVDRNWGWVLWYVPILLLVLAWVWKEFVNKPLHLDDKEESSNDPQQPTP